MDGDVPEHLADAPAGREPEGPGGREQTPLAELVRRHTRLGGDVVDHLHRLVGQWQLLADLSAADLVLWVRLSDDPVATAGGGEADADQSARYAAVAQARPATGPTGVEEDLVGVVVDATRAPLLARAERSAVTARADQPRAGRAVREVVPVRHGARVVALLARQAAADHPSNELGGAYAEAAEVLLRMAGAGTWPDARTGPVEDAPRLGDGLLRLEPDGTIRVASPNAVSAFRRLGVTGNVTGRRLPDVLAGLRVDGRPDVDVGGVVEVAAAGAEVVLAVVPLRLSSVGLGALVLLRDVTEVRVRDQALVRMDATVREVHHRVKNNLQTVAALLRMHRRRSDVPAVREALAEAERRVQAVARVHTVLTTSADETVALDEVVRHLVDSVGDVAGPAVPRPRVSGWAAAVPSAVATPLAVVVAELLQNAQEHGAADRPHARLDVVLSDHDVDGSPHVVVEVLDDGPGPPDEPVDGLGLHIARTLTTTALGGRLELLARPGGVGTLARVAVPRRPPVVGG